MNRTGMKAPWKRSKQPQDIRVHPAWGTAHPPPTPSIAWEWDEKQGTWRLPVVSGMEWNRQMPHILLGIGLALMPWLALWFAPPSITAYAVAIGIVSMLAAIHTFLRYEETEDARIRDHAYRDIRGFMVGLDTGSVAGLLGTIFGYSTLQLGAAMMAH